MPISIVMSIKAVMFRFCVGLEMVIHREDGKGQPNGRLFDAMERNIVQASAFFRRPSDDVVEIGRQVAI